MRYRLAIGCITCQDGVRNSTSTHPKASLTLLVRSLEAKGNANGEVVGTRDIDRGQQLDLRDLDTKEERRTKVQSCGRLGTQLSILTPYGVQQDVVALHLARHRALSYRLGRRIRGRGRAGRWECFPRVRAWKCHGLGVDVDDKLELWALA